MKKVYRSMFSGDGMEGFGFGQDFEGMSDKQKGNPDSNPENEKNRAEIAKINGYVERAQSGPGKEALLVLSEQTKMIIDNALNVVDFHWQQLAEAANLHSDVLTLVSNVEHALSPEERERRAKDLMEAAGEVIEE